MGRKGWLVLGCFIFILWGVVLTYRLQFPKQYPPMDQYHWQWILVLPFLYSVVFNVVKERSDWKKHDRTWFTAVSAAIMTISFFTPLVVGFLKTIGR